MKYMFTILKVEFLGFIIRRYSIRIIKSRVRSIAK